MTYKKLAQLLLPHIDKEPQHYYNLYPKRNLPQGAMVTRLGPSPTGFIHLGNLYGAFVDQLLARQSGGVFYLRIEDTDEKREVPGAVETLISSLSYFGISFDEGASLDGDLGDYGPYQQSKRVPIYQCFAKHLIEKGLAYPCFCTEESLQEMRARQDKGGENPGYYGKFASCRDLSIEEVEAKITEGHKFVLRFRSHGDPDRSMQIEDGIRGQLSMPENYQDIVLLKANGIPTYHFAHVIDDHLMGTTHVVRGEEWLSSLPIHLALFSALDLPLPIYCHTGVLMKMDGGKRRKLSKRKDPELSLDYYRGLGYHPKAIEEYLLTILNSNYEEWRQENPFLATKEFTFSLMKMSSSGTLFDIDKLNDVSKEVLVKLDEGELYDFLLTWAREYRPQLTDLFTSKKDMLLRILAMDRQGQKPRKDLIFGDQIFEFISYFFDGYYKAQDPYPKEVPPSDIRDILKSYGENYSYKDSQSEWFGKIRNLATDLGYAGRPKEFKKNPDLYKGHVGHVSTVIRIALMGRASSPDLWEIQQILGEEQTLSRINNALEKM